MPPLSLLLNLMRHLPIGNEAEERRAADDIAKQHGRAEREKGMVEKSAEFLEKGGKLYL